MEKDLLRTVMIKSLFLDSQGNRPKENIFYFHRWFDKRTGDISTIYAIVEDLEGTIKMLDLEEYKFQFTDTLKQ